MQITFDTQNPQDLAILSKLMDMATGNEILVPTGKAQPEVANNTGSTATGLNPSPEGSGVDEGAALAVAPVTEKKKTRAKKEAVAPVEKPSEETAGAPAKDTPTIDKPLSLDEVRAALQTFTASHGVPAGIELLKEFNAGRISELDACLYSEFVERCAA